MGVIARSIHGPHPYTKGGYYTRAWVIGGHLRILPTTVLSTAE